MHVHVPANCTDRLQPLDISLNKLCKDHIRKKFIEWYSVQVAEKMKNNDKTPINTKLKTMKPLSVQWMMSFHTHICNNPSIICNGFKHAGITDILDCTLQFLFYLHVYMSRFFIAFQACDFSKLLYTASIVIQHTSHLPPYSAV